MDWWQMAMEAVLLLRTALVCTMRPPTGLGRPSEWDATTGMCVWGITVGEVGIQVVIKHRGSS